MIVHPADSFGKIPIQLEPEDFPIRSLLPAKLSHGFLEEGYEGLSKDPILVELFNLAINKHHNEVLFNRSITGYFNAETDYFGEAILMFRFGMGEIGTEFLLPDLLRQLPDASLTTSWHLSSCLLTYALSDTQMKNASLVHGVVAVSDMIHTLGRAPTTKEVAVLHALGGEGVYRQLTNQVAANYLKDFGVIAGEQLIARIQSSTMNALTANKFWTMVKTIGGIDETFAYADEVPVALFGKMLEDEFFLDNDAGNRFW